LTTTRLHRVGLALGCAAAFTACGGARIVPVLEQPAHADAAWTGLRVSGTRIVDARGANVILRGFGPGEWTNTEAYMIRWPDQDPGKGKHQSQYGYTAIHSTLAGIMHAAAYDRFWRFWKSNDVDEDDFARMQSWGANSLRLSINYHWLSPERGTYSSAGWAWIDDVVRWGRAHHVGIILCLHAAPGAQSPYLQADTPDVIAHLWTQPKIYQPWTIELWKAIAKRYADEPVVIGYDLLDEPIPPKGDETAVRPFYVRVTQAIRSVDRHHIIFVEGLHFAGDAAGMRAMLPPWDDEMVLVFHKYWDKNNLASIQGYLDIRKQYGVPLWNGETGENTPSWLRRMVRLLQRNDIGWNSWTYKKVDDRGSSAYSVASPPGYDAILKYVRCLTPTHRNCAAPPPAQADSTMLQLARNDATANARFEQPVIEALFGNR